MSKAVVASLADCLLFGLLLPAFSVSESLVSFFFFFLCFFFWDSDWAISQPSSSSRMTIVSSVGALPRAAFALLDCWIISLSLTVLTAGGAVGAFGGAGFGVPLWVPCLAVGVSTCTFFCGCF